MVILPKLSHGHMSYVTAWSYYLKLSHDHIGYMVTWSYSLCDNMMLLIFTKCTIPSVLLKKPNGQNSKEFVLLILIIKSYAFLLFTKIKFRKFPYIQRLIQTSFHAWVRSVSRIFKPVTEARVVGQRRKTQSRTFNHSDGQQNMTRPYCLCNGVVSERNKQKTAQTIHRLIDRPRLF